MKISDYVERLDLWVESGDRTKYIPSLLAMLTPVSIQSLKSWESRFIPGQEEADYVAFTKEQNREILSCLHLEMSAIGDAVRSQFGMEPLTLETEVPTSC